MTAPLVALIIGEIAKQVPVLAIEIVQVINAGGSAADWAELRKKWDRPAEGFYKTPPPPKQS